MSTRPGLGLRRRTGLQIDRVLDYLIRRVEFHREQANRYPLTSYGRGTYGGTVVSHSGDPPHRVTVGNYCSIAVGVEFMIGGNHRLDWASTFPFRIAFALPGAREDGHPASNGDITVGNDVWIGRDAMILSGVTIGDGAVVGARSVVTRDIPAYTVVAGVPATPIRRRFPEQQIADLLAIRWWDWPEAEILSIIHLLNGANVSELIAYGSSRPTPQREASTGRFPANTGHDPSAI